MPGAGTQGYTETLPCFSQPYNCAGYAVCLNETIRGCHQSPMEHADCVFSDSNRAIVNIISEVGPPPPSGDGCQVACALGYHQARCAIGCIECRMDGSEAKASRDLVKCLIITFILAALLYLLRRRHKADLSSKVKLRFLDLQCPKHAAADTDWNGAECVICLSGLSATDLVRTLPCEGAAKGHCFHSKCIDRWLLKRPRCPLCNADCSTLLKVSWSQAPFLVHSVADSPPIMRDTDGSAEDSAEEEALPSM